MLRRHSISRWILGLVSLSCLLSACHNIASAFASPRAPRRHAVNAQSITALRAGGDDFSELTSALARLDQQFAIQQRSKKAASRWSKLFLPEEDNTDEKSEESSVTETNDESSNDFVWLLEPPSKSIPSCVLVFTGGAGLGQFPHIAYNELLSRVSDRLNAVCIAAPYQVGLDHFALAKQTGERLRRALVLCQDDPTKQYPATIPTYCLSHSLGSKLQTIYIGATGQTFDGIGMMSFNNFSFGKTISMGRMFAEEIRKNTRQDQFKGMNNPLDNEEMLNTIFAFAENVVGAIGVDFSPNAQDTERLIQLRYDDELQSKTRLFVFDEDNLDNSKEFLENCSGGPGPTASGLPGVHLAPVYFKFDLSDLDINDLPPDAQAMAQEAMGGFQSASFGDEEALNHLVDEICNWILGKPPSRPPQWEAPARNEPPQLTEFSSKSES